MQKDHRTQSGRPEHQQERELQGPRELWWQVLELPVQGQQGS